MLLAVIHIYNCSTCLCGLFQAGRHSTTAVRLSKNNEIPQRYPPKTSGCNFPEPVKNYSKLLKTFVIHDVCVCNRNVCDYHCCNRWEKQPQLEAIHNQPSLPPHLSMVFSRGVLSEAFRFYFKTSTRRQEIQSVTQRVQIDRLQHAGCSCTINTNRACGGQSTGYASASPFLLYRTCP